MDKFIRQTNEAVLDLLGNQILFSGLDEKEISMFIKYAAPVYLSIEEGQSFSERLISLVSLFLPSSVLVVLVGLS